MCEALRELFAEELEESRAQGIEQGLGQGIYVLIETCKEFSLSRSNTVSKVMEKFNLSVENAEKYMNKYWDEK